MLCLTANSISAFNPSTCFSHDAACLEQDFGWLFFFSFLLPHYTVAIDIKKDILHCSQHCCSNTVCYLCEELDFPKNSVALPHGVPIVDLLLPCACYSLTWRTKSISITLCIKERHTATTFSCQHGLENFSLHVRSGGGFTVCEQSTDPSVLLSIPSLQNSCQPKYSGYTSESK